MRDIVYLIGREKLATRIRTHLTSVAHQEQTEISDVLMWEARPTILPEESRVAVVHVGSGRQLEEALAFCQEHAIPLIQGATGICYPSALYNDTSFICLDAPNLSIPMIKFLYLLEEMGPLFRNNHSARCVFL
jgi:hypothetical protein